MEFVNKHTPYIYTDILEFLKKKKKKIMYIKKKQNRV